MSPRETVTLQITLTDPVPGVLHALQDKDNQLYSAAESTGADLTFTLTVERDDTGRVFGKFAMGTPTARFFYICSGTSAGQFGSPWTRRAKISLMALPPGNSFSGRINGRSKDGGPVCASVRLLDDGWRPGIR
ncbi:MAG TPA: DUF5990 family protein [Bryobacteraceae bacterium]|nr:DUF5990 family protein [Bryobacteraceae bacterium]